MSQQDGWLTKINMFLLRWRWIGSENRQIRQLTGLARKLLIESVLLFLFLTFGVLHET